MSLKVKVEFECDGSRCFQEMGRPATCEGFAYVREKLDGQAQVLDEILPYGWSLTTTSHYCPKCSAVWKAK